MTRADVEIPSDEYWLARAGAIPSATERVVGTEVALVVGGTSGIGMAVGRSLHAAGYHVVLNGRDAARGHAAVRALDDRDGGHATFAGGDCASELEAGAVVDAAVGVAGRLDVLVCAGGEGAHGPRPFLELEPAEFLRDVNARILPRVLPLRLAAPALVRTRGAAVLVTTDAGRAATPGQSAIGAAGAALMMLTKVVARELAPTGVRVNAAALTLTSGTPSWRRAFARPGFEKDLFTRALERFPRGHAPTAEEVAEVISFLASPAAAQLTGQTLSINGGLSFGGW